MVLRHRHNMQLQYKSVHRARKDGGADFRETSHSKNCLETGYSTYLRFLVVSVIQFVWMFNYAFKLSRLRNTYVTLYTIILRQWRNMRDITDVYLYFFHRHWLYKHDVSKAYCFRLQVNYNLKNKKQSKGNKNLQIHMWDTKYSRPLNIKILYTKLNLKL
jgi:hypothetical protein